jgi:hypothetical protein
VAALPAEAQEAKASKCHQAEYTGFGNNRNLKKGLGYAALRLGERNELISGRIPVADDGYRENVSGICRDESTGLLKVERPGVGGGII